MREPKFNRSPELPPDGTPLPPDTTWQEFERANRRAIEKRTEECIVITQLENWINTYAMKHDIPLPKKLTLGQFLELIMDDMGILPERDIDVAALEVAQKNFELLNNAMPENERIPDYAKLISKETPAAEEIAIGATFSRDMMLSDVQHALKERKNEIARFVRGEQ